MINLNLSKVAGGALQEQFQVGMQKLVNNIIDRNTDETKPRKLTLEITLKPKKGRRLVDVLISSKVKIASDEPIETSLVLNNKGDSEEIMQTSLFDEEEVENNDGKIKKFKEGVQ